MKKAAKKKAKKVVEVSKEELNYRLNILGQPIAMIARKMGCTDYRIKKVMKEEGIEKTSENYMTVILESAFEGKLTEEEYKRERPFCSTLFRRHPDIRFWKQFDFAQHKGKMTSLHYFLGKYTDKIAKMFELFENGNEGAEIVLRKVFGKECSSSRVRSNHLITAGKVFEIAANEKFWETVDIYEIFPNYTKGSLNYFLTDYAKSEILNRYYGFIAVIPTVEKAEIPENKVGDDYRGEAAT